MDLTNTPRTSSMTISSTIVPLENRTPIMATFISLYALIFFFGITGNALVVCKYRIYFHFNVEKNLFLLLVVVCRNKAMQTVTNVFITNLALSDILVRIFYSIKINS